MIASTIGGDAFVDRLRGISRWIEQLPLSGGRDTYRRLVYVTAQKPGVARRTLEDGTRVIYVLRELVSKLELDADASR